MASVVEICNKALSLLGQDTIVSLNDNTAEALACRTHWKPLRDRVLRGHRWNCVTKRVQLNRLLATPAFGFDYYFQLPSKCLMALELHSENFFEIEGKKLLTNDLEALLIYIEADDDTTVYDAQLCDALSFFLASELAYNMTESATLGEKYNKLAVEKLGDAKASDSLEGKRPDRRGVNWLRAKSGRG